MLDNTSNTPNKHYPKDGIITTNTTTIAINNSGSGVCGNSSGTVTVHQHPSLPRKSKVEQQFHHEDSSIASSSSSALQHRHTISKPPVIMLNSGRMSAEPPINIPR